MNEFVLPARNDTDCGLRLNSQQFIWKAVCGYNIHPTILAASNQKLKVADVEERAKIVDAICSKGFEMMAHR